MKINSLARVKDYLIQQAGLPPDRFVVATKRYNRSSTTVLVYYVTQELTQSSIELGKGITTLTDTGPVFKNAVKILQDRIYRPSQGGQSLNTAQVEIPGTLTKPAKLVTRKIGEKKEIPPEPAAAGVSSLEELDELFPISGGKAGSINL